ncbi:hemicentin-1, partial [Plakobranchus ocellatus]
MKDGLLMSTNVDPNVRFLAENRRLEVVNARVTDRGRYVCVGENIAGRNERDFIVNVFVAPTVEGPGVPERPEAIETTTVYMTCPASGIPLPKITWFREETPIKQNTSKVSLLDRGWTLEIRNTNSSDATRYFCRAENVAGDTEKIFDLKILLRPFIDRENLETEITITVNNTVAINCPVTGDPPPEIAWYKNGMPLDATNQPRYEVIGEGRQLRIYYAQVPDTGVYTCAAKSKAGEDNIDFDVKVLVPPVIAGINVNVYPRVQVDASVTINCPAQGVPPPQITWYKDGQPLVEKPGVVEIRSEGTELVLRKAQLTDSGEYKCVAINIAGENSRVFDLAVQLAPTISIIGVNTRLNVIQNRSTVLECKAQGSPKPEIMWFHNSIPVDPESQPGLTISDDGGRLVIASTQVADAGNYVCIASNEAGEAQQDYEITVWVPPVVDTSALDQNLRVIKGHTATINCPVSSIPFPDIIWTKNGQTIAESSRVQILSDGLQLRISYAEESDADKYTCLASNPAGEVTLNFDLLVLVPPSIDESNVVFDRKVSVGRTVQMECPVQGIPVPDVAWLLNGEPVEKFSRVRLVKDNRALEIQEVALSDTARYTCIATNEAGQLERNFDLEVLLRPTIDKESVQTSLTVHRNNTVRFSCPASGSPQPNITWTRKGVKPKFSFFLGIGVPPSIDESNVVFDRKVSVGRTVQMECPVQGIPVPDVAWLLNGEPVEKFSRVRLVKDNRALEIQERPLRQSANPNLRVLEGGRTLELNNAQLEDAGEYMCKATNAAGTDNLKFDLKVYVVPTMNKPSPDRLHVIQGQSISMKCSAEGTPDPTMLWLSRGSLVSDFDTSGSRLQILEEGFALQLTNAQPEDAGRYTCHAENEAGFAEKFFDLEVYEPAKINSTEKAMKIPVVLDEEVLLTCPVTGTPSPTIQWLRKGQPIPEYGMPNIRIQNNGRQLLIISAQLLDFGDYTCVASNEAGEDKLEFRISVMVPPEIQDGPESVAEIVNRPAVLQCEASGQPSPQVTWTKDGEYFPATGLRHRMLPSGTLDLMLVRLEDQGVYTCTASNAAGNVSRSIELRVQIPAKIVGRRDMAVKAAQGQDVMLSCEVEGSPEPTILWLKYRSYLQLNNRIRILDNGSLHITGLTRRDSALYTCLAQNSAGTDSKNINLRVEEPPKIEVNQREFSVLENRTIVLPCPATGRPRPKVRWEKDGQEITSTTDFSKRYGNIHFITLQTGGLAIPHTRAEDAGTFTCVASNVAGETRLNLTLKVQAEPKFKIEPMDGMVELGDTVFFDCVAEGVPEPTMYWWKGTQKLESGGRFTVLANNSLRIVATQQSDVGLYRCFATNPLGKTFVETRLDLVVHGEYSPWSSWSSCSASCGRGERSRTRTCDSPAPGNGGRNCVGPSSEYSTCTQELCPVHGNWSPWGLWGDCSLTCGGGQRRRFRSCSNPPPSGSGQPCPGSGEETETCNDQGCPVDGRFSEWTAWSDCSKTCGQAVKERYRQCIEPSNGGRRCRGDTVEVMDCNLEACSTVPIKAEGNLIGYVNNVDIADGTIMATMTPGDDGLKVNATVNNIPPLAANHLQHLISLLTPVYWTTAYEIGGAYNGFSLTRGEFMREVQVQFAT